jgi:hypothetical protein
MAIVSQGKRLSMSYQDDDLAEAAHTVDFPPATTLAAVQAYATAYAALLDPVTNCALKGYTVLEHFYDDTYPLAAAGSDVEDKGMLKIRTQNNRVKTFSWPGIVESVLLNTISPPGTYIDLANVAVAALVSALITGIAGTAPSNDRGDDFLSVVEAFKKNTSSLASRQFRG